MSALLLLLSLSAMAQDGFDGHGFTMAPSDGDLEDLLTTWRPETQAPKSFGLSGLFEYAESPVVLMSRTLPDGDPTRSTLLDNLFGINLGLHAGLHERVGVGFSAPLWFSSAGLDGAQGVSLGDGRLFAPIGVVLEPDGGGFALSAVPFLDLPLGASANLLGASGFGGGGLLAAGYGLDKLRITANLGASGTPDPQQLANLAGGGRLLAGLGGSYLVTDAIAVRAEAQLRSPLSSNLVPGTNAPAELLASVRGRQDSGLSWTVGGASGLTRGASAAVYRLFAGVGWSFGKGPFDTDGDGIFDSADACPSEPEVFNDYQDGDGCADELASVRFVVRDPDGRLLPGVPVVVGGQELGRTDAKGVFVWVDQRPEGEVSAGITPHRRTAMEPASIAAFALSPGQTTKEIQLGWLPGAVKVVTRSDQDAIIDASVSFIGGPVSMDEEALGDDGEGFFVLAPGSWTLLVSADTFGIERRQLEIKPNQRSLVVIEVTLSPAVVETTREEVVILDQVQFAFGKSEIKPASRALLGEVANNLLKFEQVAKVEVQGHTDSKGPAGFNQRLSQARVDAVMAALRQAGVPADRLTAVGYGEACPLRSNATEAGRTLNRRVQFIVVDPVPEGGVPCHDGNPARKAEATRVQVKELK